ncbi:FecCD family ABC transporter permease [Paenirhodobacter sp.]|uniref:FecCD family ABC transporter permease n=1 Tax=Paenirhodobacter sp. TaxID=1965326 RepID=UPI003B3F6D23
MGRQKQKPGANAAQDGQGPERLILAGLAVSFLFTALTNYLVFSGDQRAAHSVLFWTMGGLGLARWDNIGFAALGAGGIAGFALWNHRRLDAFLAGETTAESLGVPVARFRMAVFLAAAFATATLVALAGVIGFVGLMIPHLARRVAGPLHLRLTLACAIFGAALLLASDLLARTLLPPQELPIGIVTSSIGAFFVTVMLMRNRLG